MSLTSSKEIWDYLKKEYVGDERIRGMQVLNLIRELELQRMKDSETVKEYMDRLHDIINKVLKQRRLMRQDNIFEGALVANHKTQSRGKIFKNYLPYENCGKMGHPPYRCWKSQTRSVTSAISLAMKQLFAKKKKIENHNADAYVVNEEEEKNHPFVATCISSKISANFWLIVSGCTNHMAYNKSFFKELKLTEISKVRIRNSDQILVEGKGTVVIKTNSSNKAISDVLYVPDIDQNLLSICQLVEKIYKVSSEDKHCFINDGAGKKF
ncbi:uncharacterized protein LOC107874288 [Capsicum annuum]|uniref:uncharacterized protein LOC107874288 n=1 Tax=Capsicum annuum TaxID=4072 RepID=UPI001FB14B22|nr:uncharacterized protein LOC107874288 [Capsicum annuum]